RGYVRRHNIEAFDHERYQSQKARRNRTDIGIPQESSIAARWNGCASGCGKARGSRRNRQEGGGQQGSFRKSSAPKGCAEKAGRKEGNDQGRYCKEGSAQGGNAQDSGAQARGKEAGCKAFA